MSAWKIQRVIHRLFDGEALQRIQRKQNARRRKEILEEKMRLLMVTRWAALERRKEEFMNVFARRIKNDFGNGIPLRSGKRRHWPIRQKLTEVATEEIVSVKRAGAMFGGLGNPLVGLQRFGESAIRTVVAGGQLITHEDEPRLTNAILKHNTVSIVQVGVTGVT